MMIYYWLYHIIISCVCVCRLAFYYESVDSSIQSSFDIDTPMSRLVKNVGRVFFSSFVGLLLIIAYSTSLYFEVHDRKQMKPFTIFFIIECQRKYVFSAFSNSSYVIAQPTFNRILSRISQRN